MGTYISKRQSLLDSADQWDRYAVSSERQAAWDREMGFDLSLPGMSVGDRQAATARRAAQSLRLEAETGILHCACHVLPMSECRALKEAKQR